MTTRRDIYNPKLLEMGYRLRHLRIQKQLTITRFSEIVGLSEKIISNYENGKNFITIESIIKIHNSRVFENIRLSDLFNILVISIFEELD